MASTTIEYLESERQKIWASIVDLQDSIKKKTSDYESDAKQASKKCSEFKNKCESAKNDADVLLKKINNISNEVTTSNISTLISDIKSFHTNLTPQKVAIETQIHELEALFGNYATYADNLEKLEAISTNADDSSTKIEATLTQLTSRKKEIDQLYYEIFGYSKTDATTGIVTKVVGKKEDLDKAYNELKIGFEKFSKDKKTEFDATLIEWKKSYSASLNEIQSLLPNALTTGLSYAYSKKKDDEIDEIKELKKSFKNWILILMVISLIPFGVSAFLLLHDQVPLDQVILKLSSLVSPMLMIYVPPLWIALSTNKKINLSKRLIEEYTHKEVVAKTFEGLSKQIEGIKDHKVSSELKAKLLSNILEISTENPGKLISDYNTSDHPILERLSGLLSKNSSPKASNAKDEKAITTAA
ncbi:MAG: hypothetical protein Q8J59_05160 [Methylotenera sp.]|uniref:hypothetical protein n=1 Tax=Methylotenera sp. TaxID=2051956 RepID=UPI0027342983|nr:hypothetical protein [Methylotenera sp.]MDP2102099.1 hypothetical protein [Methylotenera sp.]MDP2281059.1 hypothetical protein [Methylotenera sp.]MDP3061154.1 hypothetical protein [Methylotenera sp.]MDP3210923.1 hypothetical protein [Methylotenera sp.]